MNVILPNSARCQENNENYFCARGVRPNFRIFREEIFSAFVFFSVKICNLAIWLKFKTFSRFTTKFKTFSRLFVWKSNSRLFPDFFPILNFVVTLFLCLYFVSLTHISYFLSLSHFSLILIISFTVCLFPLPLTPLTRPERW